MVTVLSHLGSPFFRKVFREGGIGKPVTQMAVGSEFKVENFVTESADRHLHFVVTSENTLTIGLGQFLDLAGEQVSCLGLLGRVHVVLFFEGLGLILILFSGITHTGFLKGV